MKLNNEEGLIFGILLVFFSFPFFYSSSYLLSKSKSLKEMTQIYTLIMKSSTVETRDSLMMARGWMNETPTCCTSKRCSVFHGPSLYWHIIQIWWTISPWIADRGSQRRFQHLNVGIWSIGEGATQQQSGSVIFASSASTWPVLKTWVKLQQYENLKNIAIFE